MSPRAEGGAVRWQSRLGRAAALRRRFAVALRRRFAVALQPPPYVAVGLLLAIPLAAQEAEPEVRVLRLDEALELAALNNPEYRRSINDILLTDAGMRAAWGAFLPTFDLSLSTDLNFNRRLQATDNFGNPIQNPNAEWLTASASRQNLTANVTLFEGGRRFHARSLEQAQGMSRERAAALQLTNTYAEVSTQFYETLLQSDLLALELEILEGKRRDLDSTQRLFRLASGTRVDVLAAELEVQQQERVVRQAESDYAKALLGLRVEIGAPSLGEFTTEGPAPEPFDPMVLDGESLLELALAGSPSIQRQEAEVGVGRSLLRSARGARWPTLSLGGGFYQNANAQEYSALFEPFSTDSRYAGVGVTLSMPVFTGFETQNQIAQAEVQLLNAEESVRQARLEVERGIRSQLIDLGSAYESYRLAERSRDIAEERLRLAREEYRLASRTFSDLERAIEEAAIERRAAINARYGFIDTRILLEQTIGGSLDSVASLR